MSGPVKYGDVDDRVWFETLDLALSHRRGHADDGLRPELDAVRSLFGER